MLARMHETLRTYVGSLDLGGAAPSIAFTAPRADWPDALDDGPWLSLYCTALAEPEANPRFSTEVRLSARFLATAWVSGKPAEDAAVEANDLIGRLWHALELAPMDPEAEPLVEKDLQLAPPALWQALGLTPRPAVWLTVTAAMPKPQREVKPVEYRIFEGPPADSDLVGVHGTGRGPLSGKVLSADDVPVKGAIVSLPSLNRSTRTDAFGNFKFVDVPRSPAPRVVARMGTRTAAGEPVLQDGRLMPVVLHFEP